MSAASQHTATQSATTPPPKQRASVISPTIDLLCVGGLSLLFFVPLLLSGRRDLLLIGVGAQAWLATLINMPHFMASYRLVYRSRESILRHKWASIYVPAILLVYIAIALWEAQYSSWMVVVLVSVSSAYLAWHYTGQVWGMMASYSYLEGASFERRERLLIRTGLRILLAWHVTWFLYTQLRNPTLVRPAYVLISAGTVVAFLLGAVGIAMMRRRTGRMPPLRALVAWVSLFVWYAVIARDPKALFWIQIAHAVQYLAFPFRVEINASRSRLADSTRFVRHMIVYAVILLAISAVVSLVVPGSAMSVVGNLFGEEPGKAAPIMILMFINIHHYFTDGVIWHISNPEVRRELFAHVAGRAAKPEKAGRAGATETPGKAGKAGKAGVAPLSG
jgi:hypothetical protein